MSRNIEIFCHKTTNIPEVNHSIPMMSLYIQLEKLTIFQAKSTSLLNYSESRMTISKRSWIRYLRKIKNCLESKKMQFSYITNCLDSCVVWDKLSWLLSAGIFKNTLKLTNYRMYSKTLLFRFKSSKNKKKSPVFKSTRKSNSKIRDFNTVKWLRSRNHPMYNSVSNKYLMSHMELQK